MNASRLTALLFCAWLLPGLIGHDPWKPDEAYSLGIVYSMVRDPSVVPMLAGEPFVEKPPLYYFTAAGIARLLSPPFALHDAARLATGFYLAIAALFVAFTARALFGAASDRNGVVLLLGSVGLLIRGHQLITDSALIAGFAIALYGLARTLERPMAGGLWLGTGTGIGFMAKGLLAPGILGVSALLLPLVSRSWRRREYVICLAVALAAAAPWLLTWPLALYHESPVLFHEWFWDNNFGRFLGTSRLGPKSEHGHYLKILPWYALPVLPLAAWTLWIAQREHAVTDGMRMLLLTIVTPVAVLSIAADARELYALPLLLPLSILAVPAACALPLRVERAWSTASAVAFSAAIAAGWCGWIALEFGVPSAAQRVFFTVAPDYASHVAWVPVLIAATYTAGWIVLLRMTRDLDRSAVVVWTTGLTVTWALAMTLYVGWLDSAKSYRTVAAALKNALPASYDCVSSRGLGEPQRAMFDYFAAVTTYREENPQRHRRCDLLLVQHATTEQVIQRDVLWQGARAGDTRERFTLYRVTR